MQRYARLSQFGYDLDRMAFVAESEVELLGEVQLEYDRFTAGGARVAELIHAAA